MEPLFLTPVMHEKFGGNRLGPTTTTTFLVIRLGNVGQSLPIQMA